MHETHYIISAEFRHFVKVVDLHVVKFNFSVLIFLDLLAAFTASSLKGLLSLACSHSTLTPGFPFSNSGTLAGSSSSTQRLNSGILWTLSFRTLTGLQLSFSDSCIPCKAGITDWSPIIKLTDHLWLKRFKMIKTVWI